MNVCDGSLIGAHPGVSRRPRWGCPAPKRPDPAAAEDRATSRDRGHGLRVEVAQAQATGGEGVDERRLGAASVGADVVGPQGVDDDHDEVRTRRGRGGRVERAGQRRRQRGGGPGLQELPPCGLHRRFSASRPLKSMRGAPRCGAAPALSRARTGGDGRRRARRARRRARHGPRPAEWRWWLGRAPARGLARVRVLGSGSGSGAGSGSGSGSTDFGSSPTASGRPASPPPPDPRTRPPRPSAGAGRSATRNRAAAPRRAPHGVLNLRIDPGISRPAGCSS